MGRVRVQPAFTVIETVIAMGISIAIGLVISQTFFDGWQSQLTQEAYSELQRASRFTIDEVSEQVWNASTVTSAVTLNSTTYTSDTDTLVLRLPPLDNTNTILIGDDYIIFDKNGARIERLISPLGSSVRANLQTPLSLNLEASTLLFQYYNAAGNELTPGTHDLTATRKIKATVTTARTANGRTISRTLDTTVILRNKGI